MTSMRFVLRHLQCTMVRKKLGTATFGVVSNNCWGSHIYQFAQVPYTTPFVGLFLSPLSYLHLLTNWVRLISAPLQFKEKSSEEWVENIRQSRNALWPVGLLGGEVEIQFMHYQNPQEARVKWERRLGRMPTRLDRLFFKFDDREGCTVAQMKFFDSLPLPHKVLFTAQPELLGLECAVHIRCPEASVPDGVALSRISPRCFDAAAWIGGQPQPRFHLLSLV